MQFSENQDQYYITLDKDEYINDSLLKISKSKNIQSGWINGVGAIYNIEIGYYDIHLKDYVRKKFNDGDYELLSLSGNVTIKEDEQFVHTHIIFSGTDFKVFGGHLFDAQIAVAGEFMIDSNSAKIERRFNPAMGLHLWCID